MDKVPGYEVSKPAAETKTPEQLAAEKAETDRKAAEAAAATQTPEQKAAADKAAADKAAADAAKAAETKAAENPLDKLGPLPTEVLTKAITENPALAAELEKSGLDVETLTETCRQAALCDQLIEAGATTPEVVKFMGESAQHFYDIEESFPQIKSVEDFDKFVMNTMLPLSALRDPKSGEPLMNPDGKTFQTDGSVARFMDTAAQYEAIGSVSAADRLINEYSRMPAGDERDRLVGEAQRIREAVILSQNFRDAGYKLPGEKKAATERSPEDQALLDRAAQTERDANQRTAEARRVENEAYEASVFTDASTASSNFIVENLNRTSLSDTEKKLIAKEISAEAWDALGKNRHFQMQKENLYALGNTPENKAALVALTKNTFETKAASIMRTKVAEYGGKQISRQEAKQRKIDTQITADKMNQGTGTTPAAKTAPVLTSAQVRSQAIANLKAKGNTSPDDGEILTESLAIRGLAARSA